MNSMCLGMVADFDERAGDYPAAIKALEAAIDTNQTLLGGFTGSLWSRARLGVARSRPDHAGRSGLPPGPRFRSPGAAHDGRVPLAHRCCRARPDPRPQRRSGRGRHRGARDLPSGRAPPVPKPRRHHGRPAGRRRGVLRRSGRDRRGAPRPGAGGHPGRPRPSSCAPTPGSRCRGFKPTTSTGCGLRHPDPEGFRLLNRDFSAGAAPSQRAPGWWGRPAGCGPTPGGSREWIPVPPWPQQRSPPVPGDWESGCWSPSPSIALQGRAGGKFDNSERVPGVESQHAADVLDARFPSRGGQAARIVLHTADGRLDDADHAPTVDQARAQLAHGHGVAGVTNPFAPHAAAVSGDGKTAYVDVAYAVDKLTATQLHDATAVAERTRAGGVQMELTGQLAQLEQKAPSSELIGIGIAIIVLLLAFGSVVAMGLPIVTALMGIFIGASAVGVLSAVLNVPEFSLILCSMIGLGVGIDYALFIVTRHRQHLHEGMSVEDSAGTAIATAGQAVLFAGTTVVIAILGLFLAGLPAISATGMAVALVAGGGIVARRGEDDANAI